MVHDTERWSDGADYERYVGRWSRLVARDFLGWLAIPWRRRWIDVGCGTGALSQILLSRCQPIEVFAVDRSGSYVSAAAGSFAAGDPARCVVADARALPVSSDRFDVAVSALMLNFVPDPVAALTEMTRVVRPGGVVALYVWDYAGRMEMMRHFWDTVVELNPAARAQDEGERFPLCRPDALEAQAIAAGLHEVACSAIDVPTDFADFDDFWRPFLSGQGPAPGYCLALDETSRARLRERLRERLPIEPDGEIHLMARAWALRGRKASS